METFSTKSLSDTRSLFTKISSRVTVFKKKLLMKKNKKGVLILTPFFSPNIGGVETHLDDLVAALAEKEYQVFVQTYSPITTKNTFWKSRESNESYLHIRRYKWFGGNIFN